MNYYSTLLLLKEDLDKLNMLFELYQNDYNDLKKQNDYYSLQTKIVENSDYNELIDNKILKDIVLCEI